MASVILTAVGAILNTAMFLAGSYLVKTLTGKNQDKERKRRDVALEKHQNDYNKWKKEQGKR